MPDSPQRSPLTIEDLLRLKRAERPSAEFWTRFENELRQKQLAALLEVRPWWQSFPQLLAQRRMFIPLGATAIIAFALVAPRLFVAERSAGPRDLAADEFHSAPQVPLAAVAGFTSEQSEPAFSPVAVADGDQYQRNPVAVAVPLSDHLPEHAVELTPWSAPIPVRTASSQFFAANVQQFEKEDSRMIRAISGNPMPNASSRLQRSGGAVAELASVSALASKRTRLLAVGDRQFAPEPQAPASIRERLTRRLADTSFTEHFTRIGLKGDQVSLRF